MFILVVGNAIQAENLPEESLMRKFKTIYLLLAVMVFAACGTSRQAVQSDVGPADFGYTGEMEPTFYYLEGIKAASMGDLEQADQLYAKAIALDSLHDPSYYETAGVLMRTDPEKALTYAREAVRIDSTNLWYKQLLGQLLVVTENFTEARKVYEHLVKVAPHDPDNYRLLALLYDHDGQPVAAINTLDSAENAVGRIEELMAYKQQLLMQTRQYDRAIAESENLIRDYPYKYENYLVLAEIYGQMRRDSLAEACYDKALSLNPNGLDILISRNEYYKHIGDNLRFLASSRTLFESDELPLENKIRFFQDLTSNIQVYREYYFQITDLATVLYAKYPEDYAALEVYAGNEIAGGRTEEALAAYKAYLRDTTTMLDVYKNIIEIEAYLNRSDSVAKYSAVALKHFPENADFYLLEGGALAYMKKMPEAKMAYEKALKYTESDSSRSVILGILGDMHQQEGNRSRCYSYYDRALKLWKDNVVVLNNYAYFLSVEGRRLEQALEMSSRVAELEPGNPTYLDTQGWVLYKLGRYEEARRLIQQAVSFDRTGSQELYLHYGDVLYALKEYFMASFYWQKALEAGYDAEQIAERMKKVEGK